MSLRKDSLWEGIRGWPEYDGATVRRCKGSTVQTTFAEASVVKGCNGNYFFSSFLKIISILLSGTSQISATRI
jgi:hypothetical protein